MGAILNTVCSLNLFLATAAEASAEAEGAAEATKGITLAEVPGWMMDHGTRIVLIVILTLVAVKLTRMVISKVIFRVAKVKENHA